MQSPGPCTPKDGSVLKSRWQRQSGSQRPEEAMFRSNSRVRNMDRWYSRWKEGEQYWVIIPRSKLHKPNQFPNKKGWSQPLCSRLKTLLTSDVETVTLYRAPTTPHQGAHAWQELWAWWGVSREHTAPKLCVSCEGISIKTNTLRLSPLLELCECACVCVCVHAHSVHVWLFATPWTIAHQAPVSMEFSRKEYQSGLPFPSPGNLLDPEIEPTSLASFTLAGEFFTTSATWEACWG